MLNTLGMPLQAEFFFYGSFLSEQNENLLYVQLEPLAGQEERCTLGTTLLRDESVPGITAGTGCTFISLCHSVSFSQALLQGPQPVRQSSEGSIGACWASQLASSKGWHRSCSRAVGWWRLCVLCSDLMQSSGPYLILPPGDIWQGLETFVVMARGDLILASSG